MADIDIDPFGDHDKTDSRPDETGENIALTPEGGMWEENALGNQKANKKHHSEERKLKKEGSLTLMLTVCTRSYLSIIGQPWMPLITTTLNAMVRDCTLEAGMGHSPIRMES